jgi:predicted nuclease of predicted toxin-antitoxin system
VEASALGHDVVWSGNRAKEPGDRAILESTHSGGRILVTLDKDFGELAILKGLPHSGIIRPTGFRSHEMASVIHHLPCSYGGEHLEGAIVTATPERVRIRRP